MDVAVLFSRFGPYHVARLSAAGTYFRDRDAEAYGIEIAGSDEANHYYWKEVDRRDTYSHRTLAPNKDYSLLSPDRIHSLVPRALDDIQPDVVAVNGWSFAEARAATKWCRRTDTPRILMSTSQYFDYARNPLKEFVKSARVAPFHSGFVGGTTHRDYLVRLGMPADAVVLGYNAVDNAYFESRAAEIRAVANEQRNAYSLPERYFLVVGRMVPEKNLIRLIDAYQAFLQQASAEAPDLVIAGDGPLRKDVADRVSQHGISDHVHFPGFVQYDDLPVYYALAYALLLPSLKDTWGLVVNEAMASGLPVLVSDRCGCAPHLVEDGKNGYVISPESTEMITDRLTRFSLLSDDAYTSMADASASMIKEWGPDRFAEGLWTAASIARDRAPNQSVPLHARLLSAIA